MLRLLILRRNLKIPSFSKGANETVCEPSDDLPKETNKKGSEKKDVSSRGTDQKKYEKIDVSPRGGNQTVFEKADVRRKETGQKCCECGGVIPRARDTLDLTFNDYRTAFKSKTTWEVSRALLVYTLTSFNTIVENNEKLMKLSRKIFGNTVFGWMMKMTFYGHFVGGEDEKVIQPRLKRLASFGVHSILDYSVEEDLSEEEAVKRENESGAPPGPTNPRHAADKNFPDRRYKVLSARTYFYLNEATCERNMETFIRSLEAVPANNKGLVAIKLTALGKPQLLLQISEVIVRTRQYATELMGKHGNVMTQKITKNDLLARLKDRGVASDAINVFLKHVVEDETGVIHLFPWSGIIDSQLELSSTFVVPQLGTGNLVRLISELSKQDEEMFKNMIRRVSNVIRVASNLNVSVMVDAEQTYFQPAISRITMELMRKFNSNRAVVRNTYQCYLKDTYNELKTDLDQAQRQNFYFGAKLVRGAYLEQERTRARTLGYPDPTNQSYEETSEMYHKSLSLCIERIQEFKRKQMDSKRVEIMIASHNEDTVRYALEEMLRAQMGPEDGGISFGQLYGMCDYITFPLGQAGYMAYKYIPYGPVNEVLPYLSRRAQENRGVFVKIQKEKRLLRKELLRRVATLHFFREPKGFYSSA